MAAAVAPRGSHAKAKMIPQISIGHEHMEFLGVVGQHERCGRNETVEIAADGSHDKTHGCISLSGRQMGRHEERQVCFVVSLAMYFGG
jgi:hypothetical protein